MVRKPLTLPSSHHLIRHTLDRNAAERVTQWVTRWHGADYDKHEIAAMVKGWPSDPSLRILLDPFGAVPDSESARALAGLASELILLVERKHIEAVHARGAFRMACRRLCERGIPFEETAKGDETALWFHFIATNEFGDAESTGYATDLSELRLLAREMLDPELLAEDLLAGEFPPTYHEGYVNVAAALGDRRLVPRLLLILGRCEDPQSVATTIGAIGQIYSATRADAHGDRRAPDESDDVHDALAGYARSTNVEIATATVLALEALGSPRAELTLRELSDLLTVGDTMLSAHVEYGLLHIRHGEDIHDQTLVRVAADRDAPTPKRLCAIERLSGLCQRDAVERLSRLLDDPTVEPVRVDGYLTDDVVYVVREAAFMALMECPIRCLVEVLGEGILARLETFQIYGLPSWWLTRENDGKMWNRHET